ncbi:scramblase, partial [Mycobacterium sp. ITM-2017-0098]
MTAAGWYPDPLGGPQQRFFDGRQWTDHYAAQVDPSQLPPPQGISPTGTTGASSVRPRQIA